MPSPRRVALLIESYVEYGRGLLRGIASYMQSHAKWTAYHQPWGLDAVSRQLKRWRPDGMIAQLESRRLVRHVQEMGIPVVGFSPFHLQRIPTLLTDHQSVAHLAAQHLIERGFKHFAYAGFAGIAFSHERQVAFAAYLRQAGYPVAVFEGPRIRSLLSLSANEAHNAVDSRVFVDWLKTLPRPLGLMACGDLYARQVINACTEYGIVVPDEVAVIGVGNDEVLCKLCDPQLSSVVLNPEKTGYEAAAMLDRLMHGERLTQTRVLTPPQGIITRQSTDVLLDVDQDIASAIRYLRERACEGIRVTDVCRHMAIPRSTLQRRIFETLGRSPKAELLRVQIERVKTLLATTDLPVLMVAQQAGFNHVECMCRLFKKCTNRTPRQYRNDARR